MVKFYQPKQKKTQRTSNVTVHIDHVTNQGEGICRSHNPPIYVQGGLPGETVKVDITLKKKSHWQGKVISNDKVIEKPYAQRQSPFCAFYQQCGGCTTQHSNPDAMLEFKRNALDGQFCRALKLTQLPWTEPVMSPVTAYRRKARLAVDARNPNKIKVGFKSAGSGKIIDISRCPILEPELQNVMEMLHAEVTGRNANYQAVRSLGHIILQQIDGCIKVTLSYSRDLSADAMHWWSSLASKINGERRDSIEFVLERNKRVFECFYPSKKSVPDANDFVQVNAHVNQKMIALALNHLALQANDKVLDLFAGLGNFTFPIAENVAVVNAIEGSEEMVHKAQSLAQERGVMNVFFSCKDLSDKSELTDLLSSGLNKVLLDPSREGAQAVCEHLAASKMEKIVYISCNPQTWLRDAKVLINGGFALSALTIMDMFPYTPHSELLSVFTSK